MISEPVRLRRRPPLPIQEFKLIWRQKTTPHRNAEI